MKRRRSIESRFWDKVDKRGPDECWEWTGARFNTGGPLQYGKLWYRHAVNGRERMLLAHRISALIHRVQRPLYKTQVLHHCDNAPCVNPAHLYWGDIDDNMRDKVERHRSSQHWAKLNSRQVAEMRRDYWEWVEHIHHEERVQFLEEIAEKYGLAVYTATAILRGRYYTRPGTGLELCRPLRKVKRRGSQKLVERDVLNIREAYASGVSVEELCDRFGVTKMPVYSIISGKSWTDVGGPIKAYGTRRRRTNREIETYRKRVS